MQVVFPDTSYAIRPAAPMDVDAFFEFCMKNPDLRIEREANGEILLLPKVGAETSYRFCCLNAQLYGWSKSDGRGRSFGAGVGVILRSGAVRSPNGSWFAKQPLALLSREQKRRFLPLCPDFVVELTSPVDPLAKVKAKMEEWIANGAALGWLIDADNRTVYVYRGGLQPERLIAVSSLEGEGPVAGFHLDLTEIWEGI